MSDGILSDDFIVPPAVMIERQLHTMRLELQEIRDGISRPSNFRLVRMQRDQLRDIARLAAEAVQKIDSAEWAGGR